MLFWRILFRFRHVITVALLVLLFFSKQVAGKEVFFCCDNLLITIPARVYEIQELRLGRFPLWNPYIFSGAPFLADINLSALYPSFLFYGFLLPFTALTWTIITHVLVMVLGMYLLCRALDISPLGSMVAAAVFGFSGATVTYINNASILQVAALFPWIFRGWVRYLDRPVSSRLIAVVVLSALQLLAGHPQLTFLTWLLVLAYVLIVRMPWKQRITHVVTAVSLTFLLASIQLLPFLEFAFQSTRIGSGFSAASFGSLNPGLIVRFILPTLVGKQASGTAWVQGGSIYGYVGFFSLLLLAFAPWGKRRVRLLGGVAFVSLFLALGSYTPMFWIAYHVIPGLALFRVPSHFLFLYTVAVSLLSGFSLDRAETPHLRKRFLGVLARVAIVSGLIYGVTAWLAQSSLPAESLLSRLYLPAAVAKIHVLSQHAQALLVGDVARNVLFVTIVSLTLWVWTKRKIPGIRIVWATGIVVELFLFSRSTLLSVSQQIVNQWEAHALDLVQGLKPFDGENDRLFVHPSSFSAPRGDGPPRETDEASWQFRILRPNLSMLFGLASIDGYASIVSKDYQKFLGEEATDPTGITIGDRKDRLGILGVRYVLTKESDPSAPVPSSWVKRAPEQRIGVYENTARYSRIFFQSGSSATTQGVLVRSYAPNSVRVSVTTPSDGQLVFVDTNLPGWQARVDREPVPIEMFQGIAKAVAVSRGSHDVEFFYRPASFVVGGILSAVGIMIVLILLVRSLIGKTR